jgi:hypothetical protein
MVQCEICEKEFDFNYLLQRHLNKKKPCKKKISIKEINESKISIYDRKIILYDKQIEEIQNNIQYLTELSVQSKKSCKFCNKKLANKNNVERHIENSCNNKKYLINDKEEIIIEKNKLIEEKNKLIEEYNKTEEKEKTEELQNQIKILQNTVQKLMNKNIKETPPNTIINNNTTINNPTINNNLTININSFGKESLNHITETDYKKYLNGFFKGFLNLIEKIHFDENAPENHNVCLTNMRSKYAYVCENNNWVLKDKEDIINKLINKKYDLLNDKFEELEENNKLNNKILDNFKEFQENYNDTEAQKNTKENVKLMLYNNREKIEKKIKK